MWYFTDMALKANSKKILKAYASQKQKNGIKAYKTVHKDVTDKTATNAMSKLLQKPDAQIYLKQHIDQASETIVDIMLNSDKDTTRLSAAQDVLDRSHGKATQTTENKTTVVTLNLDLSDISS